MQLVERPWGVTVHGTAEVRAKPDLVRIGFTVSRKERTPSQAFATTTEVVAAVREALHQHDVPDEAVHRSQLDLQTSWGHHGGQTRVDGYTCSASFTVETADLDGVPRLLAALVEVGVHGIGGLEFDVAARDALQEEAGRQAVHAARRKAESYAETAGVRLGAVVHIEDVPARRGHDEPYPAAAASAPSRDVLVPGHVTVSAAVIVGFAIDQADGPRP